MQESGITAMTYEEARRYTETISRSGSILGLANIKNLMHELSDVQDTLSVFHIAGTNGKGSTGTFLSCCLMEAGYRVGRYTSPAVFTPLEVWQINGIHISKEDYTGVLSQVKSACDRMVSKGMPHPTVFEVETAVAFLYFYEQKCDYVVLETGMGGETDATNVVSRPVCSVLTSISMDHMQFLGNTLKEIASAKAGIIKDGCPAVTVLQEPEAMNILNMTAAGKCAELTVVNPEKAVVEESSLNGSVYQVPKLGEISVPMAGFCQIENSYLAAAVLKQVLGMDTETIKAGIRKAVWPGRFEILSGEPLFIIDGAHNQDAVHKLSQAVQNYFTNRRITYIIGVLADKEYGKMLKQMLPFACSVYTVTPGNQRALDADRLAEEAAKYHPAVVSCGTVGQAVDLALEGCGRDGVVLAFGSLSYLGEVKHYFIDRKIR